MKVKKITLNDVQGGQLKSALHRKELLKAIQTMEKDHNQAENSVDFFFKMDQNFDGLTDKPELLCLLGSRKNQTSKNLNLLRNYKNGHLKSLRNWKK